MTRPSHALLPGTVATAALLLLAPGCGEGGSGKALGPGSMAQTPPRVAAVAPTRCFLDGGATAIVRGSGFQEGAEVHFGTAPSTAVTRLSTAELQALIPPAAVPGPVDLWVRNPSGESAGLRGVFVYEPYPPPVVLGVEPTTGNARRAVPVRVTGSGFRPGARLFFGSKELEPVQLQGEGVLTAELPPTPPGRMDVAVENLDGLRHELPGGYLSALQRDTPIAGVHLGRVADILDETLAAAKALEDQLVAPELVESPGLWRALPDDPLSGKARIQILAARGSQAWQETLDFLGRDVVAVPAWGWGAPGKAPAVPRDCGLRVTFQGDLGMAPDFWLLHPGAAVLLAIQGDPQANPAGALRELPCRKVVSGAELLLIPVGPATPLGLPAAPEGPELATVRIAFPLEGPDSIPTLQADAQVFLEGSDHLGQAALIRDVRAARDGEALPGAPGGLLPRMLAPGLRAELPVWILSLGPGERVVLDKLGLLHSVDALELLVQGEPAGVAVPVRRSSDTPGEPAAEVEVAGADRLAPGPARLLCRYRQGVDDGALFLRFDPPAGPGGVSPLAVLELDFGEPVGGHLPLEGWLLGREEQPARAAHPKLGTPGIVPVRLQGAGLEAGGLFTKLRMTPMLGLPHKRGCGERYTLHLLEQGAGAVRGLSGRPFAEKGFSACFTVDPLEPDLPAVYIVRRFLSADEDGTRPEAAAKDWWGAGRVEGGRLQARAFARFQARTGPAELGAVLRGGDPLCAVPFPLYRAPDFDFLGKGGLLEPFVPGGSRLQATWREDDLGLSRTDPAQMHLEVEGLALAPFDPGALVPESLDSITLQAGHAACRPDLRPMPEPGSGLCGPDPAAFASGLDPEFRANYLDAPVRLLDNAAWRLDPKNLRLDPAGRRWLPLPALLGTFLFRDLLQERRGGALSLQGPTLDLESPWAGGSAPRAEGAYFAGDRIKDHRAIALPLLLDFLVPPADPWKASPFLGANRFRAGHVLPPWPLPGHGLYAPQPAFRAHTSAGPDREKDPPVDPFLEQTARGGFEWDGFLGSRRVPWATPPTDDHLPWLEVDLLARTSVITFGFVDLTRPGRAAFEAGEPPAWPAAWRPVRFWTPEEFDAELPPGTALRIQWRGARDLANADLWNPLAQDDVPLRGNLLNPLYACDADRLSERGTLPAALTKWVDDPAELVDPSTGLGPRYLCWRVILEGAEGVAPPALRSLVLGAVLAEGK